MEIARRTDLLDQIRQTYGEAVEKQVKEKVGDGVIVDYWFDRVLGHPAIWFRYGVKVDFVRL